MVPQIFFVTPAYTDSDRLACNHSIVLSWQHRPIAVEQRCCPFKVSLVKESKRTLMVRLDLSMLNFPIMFSISHSEAKSNNVSRVYTFLKISNKSASIMSCATSGY